jgi:prophage regulatory protein
MDIARVLGDIKMNQTFPTDIIRLPVVIQQTGLARSSIYRRVKEGDFPSPVRLSLRAIGWHRKDIEVWQATRPATQYARRDLTPDQRS